MVDIEITDSQSEVLSRLPQTRRSIADELDISLRAVRGRMKALKAKGFGFYRDKDGVWHVNRPEEKTQRINSYQKAQATKDINDSLTSIEKDIKEVVNATPPVVSTYEEKSGDSTLVIPRSDDHFGAMVDARNGEGEFKSDVANQRINEIVDRAINRADEKGGVNNVVLGLFGDHVDGETIYPAQGFDIEEILREQAKRASKTYVNQIRKLSEQFDHVKVVTVPGNHGEISKHGATNADNIVFDQIETAISWLDLDNVTMKKSNNNNFIGFKIRNHQAYARHGQDSLGHLGTSSGQNRWFVWSEGVDFNIAYYGHFHQFKVEMLGKGRPVIQCGSVVPPSLYADSVSEDGRPTGFYHFANNEEVIEEIQPVRF